LTLILNVAWEWPDSSETRFGGVKKTSKAAITLEC
jgi:hypothetical protein